MSIVITNISNTFSEKGLQGYVLKINNKEICRFTHVRTDGLSQCLYRAYLETGGDDYIGDLIAKLADADAEIKRLEAEVERFTNAMSFSESKALDRVAELETEVGALKCCGNCAVYVDNDCSNHKVPNRAYRVCELWSNDGLTAEERK